MAKKPRSSRSLNVYSNLSRRRKATKDVSSRRRAEYLASLPKHPVKRALYRLHPKRLWAYWFSKKGLFMALKVAGVAVLLVCLLVGGLFAYFRKDLDQIRPEEINKRVQSTVTNYYDRNGQLLWEDKGDGNYKLVVSNDELSPFLKQATVAIEDRDFYKHSGVSFTGTVRAAVNNATGGQIQGGSTLTQQLVKQVFFADEAGDRGLGGIPRKIKELILAIEVERMYDKDQILSLYLNESPYGGRRNGAESGAQTYFGKSAKDLTLPEASLLAAIPQNPSTYDPYNVAGHEALIARQHRVIDSMVEVKNITQEEGDKAKAFPILDSVRPVVSQYDNIKAPHFVQMVRAQLESELGKATVGRGGLNVTTTLDIRIQDKLQQSMDTMFASSVPRVSGFSNGAATVEDTKTGQIIALLGSRDFGYEGFGQDNAATAFIQPGSTIKPLVFSKLFEQKAAGQQNYGSGSILRDEPIDSLYGAKVQNADRSFKGDISIRNSLGNSRNIPAIKAMSVNGIKPTLETIRALGATSYCTQGSETQVGLASAIGGCGIKQIDLVNAYASLGRGGVYKPQSSVLEVKNSSGDVIKKWADTTGKQIVSAQSAYVLDDILSDPAARSSLSAPNAIGMAIPGVKTATKTGTSDFGGNAKDIWMMSYSPVLTMGVWLGNPDTTVLKSGTSSIPGPIIANVMGYAHRDIYASDGKWKSGDWFAQPTGIQKVGKEVYPAWWSKSQGQSNTKLVFDRVSRKRATDCTPPAAKIELAVVKSTDPITKRDIYSNVPEGYSANEQDDAHKCDDTPPSIPQPVTVTGNSGNWTIVVTPSQGTFALSAESVSVTINGTAIQAAPFSGNVYRATFTGTNQPTGTANVTDNGFYAASRSF